MKSTFKINLNTRGQIAVLIAIASIIVAIGGYFIYNHQANKTLRENEKKLTLIAKLESKQLSAWFHNELKDIQIITTYSFVAEEVKKILESNALADKSRLTKFLSQIRNEEDYNDVIIASADGKLEIWAGEHPGVLNEVERRTIEKAYLQKKTLSTELFRHKSDGEEKIIISFISLIKDADNNILAALIGRYDVSQTIYPIIDGWPIPSQTAESSLFKLENDSIVYLNNLKHNNNAALNLRIPVRNTELLASQAVSGKLGLVSGKDYRNEDVTGFVSRIEGTPWYLISKIDDSEMYQGKYVIAGVVAGFVLLLIFIIIFFIVFIFNRRQKNIYKELYNKEKEVWQQQEKFKVTMDSLGEGVIVTDMDAKVQYINKHAEALTGWNYSDALGRNIGEIYPLKNEETGEKENNILEKVIKSGIVKELANHTLLVTKSGKEIPVMDIGAPIFDDEGSLTGIVITFQDETEKRAQNCLIKESERNLREFFENDITGDYAATADGELLKCNPAFARILGYSSPDELVGRNIIEFYRDPVDREEFLKIIQVSKIMNGFDMILKYKDGSEIFCKENIVGVFDESGSLVRYFGYLQDITEQKEAEDKLQNREQLLSSVMDTQQELICRFLPDTTLTFVNKAYCKLFSKTEEELLGQKFLVLVPESEWEDIFSNLKNLNKKNPQITYKSSAFKADGSVMTIEWTDIAIFNNQGELVEFQSVGHDISEKLKSEKELLFLLKMNELLRKIAADYISLPMHETDSYIEMSLGEIGKFIKADRVYIFDYDWQLHTCSNTFEWCEEAIEPQIDNLQNVSLDDIPHWWNPHKQGIPLIVDDVLALEESDVVRQILEPQKVKSLITIPILDKGNCLGFVGLDYVQDYYSPSKREKDVLFVFADVLASINRQVKINKELVKSKEKAEESDKLKTAFINNISHEI
ncbi:MAG: PAS domain S-box protein, partial [Bacteroidetes bacterium]|nr:PAS domain S-box protein [Bacteroidota bacterium]